MRWHVCIGTWLDRGLQLKHSISHSSGSMHLHLPELATTGVLCWSTEISTEQLNSLIREVPIHPANKDELSAGQAVG